MARGRPRKRGNTRTDAALDAMRVLGFSSNLVRRTLKNLLAEYGGDDGWVFIEEASYLLLVETLLLLQNSGDDDEGTQIVAVKDTQTGETSLAKNEASRVSDGVTPSKHQIDNTSGGQEDSLESVGEEREGPKRVKRYKFGLENVKVFEQEDTELCFERKNGKAFHGWMGEEDEEFDAKDVVEMQDDPFVESLMKCVKRQSRWDGMS